MKWRQILSILLACCLLTGCWDRKELSQTSLVTGIAIDAGEKQKYRVSLEVLNATELNTRTAQGETPALVFTVEGNTIAELLHKMNVAASQKFIYSHMRLLAISEDAVNELLLDFLDFFERNREIRSDFNIVLVKGNRAEDILKVVSPIYKNSSLKIGAQLTQMYRGWGGDPGMRLDDFIRVLTSEGQVPVIANLSIEGDLKKGMSVDNLKNVIPEAKVKLEPLAVFKNSRVIGYLTLNDTRNLLMIQNKMKQTYIGVPCNNKKKVIGIHVVRSVSDVSAKEIKGIPTFRVKIRAIAVVEEVGCKQDLLKSQTFDHFENLINNQINKDIQQLVKKMQKEYQADIFGFGELLRENDYKHFKKYKNNWEEGFVKSKVSVDFKVTIKRSGTKKNSYEVSQ
ncbi:Ger(x)C family spore germination protein [Niallia nealsonii]|uniref:Ger(X)C family spore germination protein n=1 Tax=Niallia nealsonii TaxID=115979 RepID=A0A2N0Z0U1_9BACI|nr:Ger(x)C family spore germination protein [Niallia nealsonii]PKG23136.1 Ger(x)C family spore germination protein [Niallia nealsonii]